jgi:hypothetical protein
MNYDPKYQLKYGIHLRHLHRLVNLRHLHRRQQ